MAVDDTFSARIPSHEDHSHLQIGDVIEAKVVAVKEDGKLDLTLREKAYIQMDADAEKLMEIIDSYADYLDLAAAQYESVESVITGNASSMQS